MSTRPGVRSLPPKTEVKAKAMARVSRPRMNVAKRPNDPVFNDRFL